MYQLALAPARPDDFMNLLCLSELGLHPTNRSSVKMMVMAAPSIIRRHTAVVMSVPSRRRQT